MQLQLPAQYVSHPKNRIPAYKDEINNLKSIVEIINTGILFTHGNMGKLNGRPMTTVKIEQNANLWFFTNEFSRNVSEICQNNEVVINYAVPGVNTYAAVKGKAYLTREINKINELYVPAVKTWFPEGLNDPSLLLLRVEPTEIQCWQVNPSKVEPSKKISRMFFLDELQS
jgi:general stress protein 26